MVDRVRPRDLTFLEQESAETPQHNATIEIFDPGEVPTRSTTAGWSA